eukprot:maker-scaffold5442_size4634-snap-gene-0.2 protein:Tk07746 transcript:maker-scaffold5442_size4634-snap-gene-0.2-mRNA-1 annotation:"hypothetical protein"
MSKNIESHLSEDRVFKPSKEFSKKARVKSMAQYKRMYQESIEKPGVFWGREAKELAWQKKWTKALEWKAPYAKWFVGGKLNVCESCVDQHLSNGRANKAAIIWEGEPGESRTLTYRQLHREVCNFANVLIAKGIKPKDRVMIYMPMTPEAVIAMLACARIGAVHSVIFGGFSADSIVDRLEDCQAKAIITTDGGYRRGGVVQLKQNVDDALKKYKKVEAVIVHQRIGQEGAPVTMKRGRDVWWHEEAAKVMYEGAPNHPDFGRFWDIVEKYSVSIFYTAPTAIRAFIKAGDEFPDARDLSSLRLLGTVGEPINPEAWMWYHEKIGGGRCPIVDTWWQTETGAIMISPLPGCTPTKPGTATLPFFGVDAAILDETGEECGPNEGGKLVIRKPWPSMLRTIYGDKKRYRDTYWNDYEGMYTAGDGARTDKSGNFWIVGRLDDVLNVSGHRLGTAEVESALVSHQVVAESAVVGRPHEIKGQGVVAFVTVKGGVVTSDELAKELRNHVGKVIGAIAKPDDIYFTPALPKTRSGKIMRRLLKELVATGEVSGNITTLEDSQVIADLQAQLKK